MSSYWLVVCTFCQFYVFSVQAVLLCQLGQFIGMQKTLSSAWCTDLPAGEQAGLTQGTVRVLVLVDAVNKGREQRIASANSVDYRAGADGGGLIKTVISGDIHQGPLCPPAEDQQAVAVAFMQRGKR